MRGKCVAKERFWQSGFIRTASRIGAQRQGCSHGTATARERRHREKSAEIDVSAPFHRRKDTCATFVQSATVAGASQTRVRTLANSPRRAAHRTNDRPLWLRSMEHGSYT